MVDQMTTEKPKKPVEKPKEEELKKEPEKTELEEQIEVLEPVAKVIERKLKIGEDEKTFLQHEMSFFSKLKFFRLMSGTLRLATEEEGGSGVADLIQDAVIGAQQIGSNSEIATVFLDAILRLVELAPDFMEETYLLALNVKPEDSKWVIDALQYIDDDTGLDILDVFVAQNGKAISDFFSKRLGKLTKRISQFVPTQEESETTT